jgi:nucleotide-binding universal stress UspA family protein
LADRTAVNSRAGRSVTRDATSRSTVVVATDGSRHARAAVATALAFPWPASTHVSGVVALRSPATRGRPQYVVDAYERAFARVAAATRQALRRRWRDADVVVVDARPVDAILGEAQRRRAAAIVLGSRGHGVFRRIVLGSVSRSVIRRARCPVLVVRRRPRAIGRFVIGIDGSTDARHAARFVAGLTAVRGGRVVLVRVVEPLTILSPALMPGAVRAALRSEEHEIEEAQRAKAAADLQAAAAEFERSGWTVETVSRAGAPLHELLEVVDAAHGDVLVLGARGAGRVERLLLGSVAEGALNHARVPVLVVK